MQVKEKNYKIQFIKFFQRKRKKNLYSSINHIIIIFD